jgi:RNA polymerase sigma-70 factor (ECF subfamily)
VTYKEKGRKLNNLKQKKMKQLEVKNIEQVEKDKACAIAMQSSNKAKAQDAFNQIYKRYKGAIHFLALKFVKLNEETAEDLTQEIFVKVFEKIGSYNANEAVFSTWLYKIANNHLIDYKRKTKVEVMSIESLKSEFGGDDDVAEISFQLEDKSADTFRTVVKAERAVAVLDALQNGVKSEDAKQIITLIYLDDMAYDKVAEKMKMPIGTVKALMFRAKKELKEYLSVRSRDFSYMN